MQHFEPSDMLAEARAYEAHMETFIPASERPAFHLTPRVGWMNDPNGFSYFDGCYHLFYQYNPYRPQWGTMHWGHAVSTDLLHWEYRPAALAPDQRYDSRGGCFSGSAVTLADGRHLLMYTGVADGPEREDGQLSELQQQCLAFGDGTDYVKYEGNPVIGVDQLPEGGAPEHFRDPKIWQEADGSFRAVVANLDYERGGQILLYRSTDAFSWEFESVLARNNNRFGYMWECPDYFELDGASVLLVSPQDMLPEGHDFHGGNGSLALIGHRDPHTGELVEESARTIDHGIDFYATQTLLAPDGRRIMVGWMQNWDSVVTATPEDRWFGRMCLPRELSVREGRLYQQPVREIEQLHVNRVAYEGVRFEGEIGLEGIEGRLIDLELTVRPANPAAGYKEFALWFAQNDRFHTSVRYRPESGVLKVNRARSGSRRAVIQERKLDVQPLPDGSLKLRLVLDRSCAELFVNDGAETVSTTIPTDPDAQGITFFADGCVVIDVEKYDLDATGANAR